MLAALAPEQRLASAHTVGFGGVHSCGDAVIDVLGALPRAAFLYKTARAMPALTNLVYGVVAGQRRLLGKLVPAPARNKADEYLRSASDRRSGPESRPSP
jgi:predicted DCC family thiol-disulfide oxidoreductase YuxK